MNRGKGNMDSEFSNRKKNRNIFDDDDDFNFGSRKNTSGGGGNNNNSYGAEQVLETQNDKYVDNINSKVSDLKRISLDIESQVQESQTLLERLETELHGAQSLLSNTMKKLNEVSKTATSRHMLYLIIFVVFIFILIYMIVSYGGSSSNKTN